MPGDDKTDDGKGDSNVILLPNLRAGAPPPRPRPLFEDDDELSPEDLLAPPRPPQAVPPPQVRTPFEPLADSGPPPDHLLEPAVEALLFTADSPLTEEALNDWLEKPGRRKLREALRRIQRRLRQERRGWQLVEIARGWQLRTDVTFARWVSAMRGGKPTRLSKAALETLSIVAYRQPVTRSEIEELRGVDAGGVLRSLVERDLVTTVGRKDEPGRPLLYGTTAGFLSLFGLRNLSDLPTLRDLRSLQEDTAEGPAAGSAPTPKPVRRPDDVPPPPLPMQPALGRPEPVLTRNDLITPLPRPDGGDNGAGDSPET